jgi:hypothetical protein
VVGAGFFNADAARLLESDGRAVSWVGELLIVDFSLLQDNARSTSEKFNRQSLDLLGRRLMVGQVPLEHFV